MKARGSVNGLLVALVLAVLAATWVLMTQPKEWVSGTIVRGRGNCTTQCRVRGGVADLLEPKAAPHCLCGRGRMHW